LQDDAVEVTSLEPDRGLSEEIDSRDHLEPSAVPVHRVKNRCLSLRISMLIRYPSATTMASDPPHAWRTSDTDDLLQAVLSLRTTDEAARFLRDLCTRTEIEAMVHRWQVAQLVDQGLPYHEVARRTGASTTTVTRVAHWLRHGEGGYRLALDRRKRAPAATA
jgi:TrpR-related protein YerC/YecD